MVRMRSRVRPPIVAPIAICSDYVIIQSMKTADSETFAIAPRRGKERVTAGEGIRFEILALSGLWAVLNVAREVGNAINHALGGSSEMITQHTVESLMLSGTVLIALGGLAAWALGGLKPFTHSSKIDTIELFEEGEQYRRMDAVSYERLAPEKAPQALPATVDVEMYRRPVAQTQPHIPEQRTADADRAILVSV